MWHIKSFNGISLNDATYFAFLADEDNPTILPTINATIIKRGAFAPEIAGLEREPDVLLATVRIKAADWRAAMKTLGTTFRNDETSLHPLIVIDSNGTEWTVQARAKALLRPKTGKDFKVLLDVPDRIWSKAATPVIMSITSSPANQAVTNAGNTKSAPKFTWKPTAQKNTGFLYRHWVPIRNATSLAFVDFGLDLAGGTVNASVSNQINQVGGITAAATTIAIDTAVGGGLPTIGIGKVDDEIIAWLANSGSSLTNVLRGLGGTAAATHADNAVITGYGLDTTGWVADATISNQINQGGGITDAATTIPIDTDVGGGLPNSGMGYVDTEQIAWTGKSGGQLTGVTRGIGGTAAATHADNAVIKLSYMLANGADLRFYLDGLETSLWLDGINTTLSHLWAVINLVPKIELALKTQIAATGDVTALEFALTTANREAFAKLPTSGMIQIGDEMFTYSSKTSMTLSVTVAERAAKDTSMALHAVGATCYWIEHDAWIYSGNPSLSAETDDTKKPMLDLGDSSNLLRVWYEFRESTGLRVNSFMMNVLRSSNVAERGSRIYTGDHQDETADPATEAGMRMMATYRNGRWNPENGKIATSIYEPAGIQAAAINAEKYRVGSWPNLCRMEKSKDGVLYASQYAIATPSVASSWQSIASGWQSFGTGYRHMRVLMEGVVNAGASYEADVELNDCAIALINPPVVSIGTRQTNSYEANFSVENAANGQSFQINFTGKLDGELVIDCKAKTIRYLVDGQYYRVALTKPTNQTPWMELEAGSNTLTYTEEGATGVTLTIEYDDMLVA